MSNSQLTIDNDQLPEGYKQTEVGVIPQDWNVKELASLITAGPKNGYSGRTGETAKGTPTLRLTATSYGYLIINDETVKYLDETIDLNSDLFLKPGDVLIQRSNTYELVGTTAIFDGSPKTYVYPDLMMRLRFSDQLTAHWFWKYANSTKGRRFFLSAAAGSTGSMPKISGAKLRAMPVPLPPENERRSISQALSNVDHLIAALEKAIAKKRAIKTATMQQLLTGKKRLPGFGEGKGYQQTEVGVIPEDWDVNSLLELSEKITVGIASAATHAYRNRGIPLIRNQNIKPNKLDDGDILYISEDYEFRFKNKRLQKGDLLTARTGYPGTTCIVPGKFESAQSFTILITRPSHAKVDCQYLSFFINSDSGQSFFEQNQIGGGQKNVNAGTLRNLLVPLPSSKEQRAIATVLSDMDAEIATLETRLAKTQSIKQGMMQQLLTGKVRLKIEA